MNTQLFKKSNAICPLADICMGYIVNKFRDVQVGEGPVFGEVDKFQHVQVVSM